MGLSFLLAVLALPVSAILSVPEVHAAPLLLDSTSTIAAYIQDQVDIIGASSTVAMYVSREESHLIATSTGDMDIICKYKRSPNYGKPVRAKGIWQITDCYHPEITDKQAYDVIWSTAWALPRIASTSECTKEWTTCRTYYNEN